jgi:hypothetical protein
MDGTQPTLLLVTWLHSLRFLHCAWVTRVEAQWNRARSVFLKPAPTRCMSTFLRVSQSDVGLLFIPTGYRILIFPSLTAALYCLCIWLAEVRVFTAALHSKRKLEVHLAASIIFVQLTCLPRSIALRLINTMVQYRILLRFLMKQENRSILILHTTVPSQYSCPFTAGVLCNSWQSTNNLQICCSSC